MKMFFARLLQVISLLLLAVAVYFMRKYQMGQSMMAILLSLASIYESKFLCLESRIKKLERGDLYNENRF